MSDWIVDGLVPSAAKMSRGRQVRRARAQPHAGAPARGGRKHPPRRCQTRRGAQRARPTRTKTPAAGAATAASCGRRRGVQQLLPAARRAARCPRVRRAQPSVSTRRVGPQGSVLLPRRRRGAFRGRRRRRRCVVVPHRVTAAHASRPNAAAHGPPQKAPVAAVACRTATTGQPAHEGTNLQLNRLREAADLALGAIDLLALGEGQDLVDRAAEQRGVDLVGHPAWGVWDGSGKSAQRRVRSRARVFGVVCRALLCSVSAQHQRDRWLT